MIIVNGDREFAARFVRLSNASQFTIEQGELILSFKDVDGAAAGVILAQNHPYNSLAKAELTSAFVGVLYNEEMPHGDGCCTVWLGA